MFSSNISYDMKYIPEAGTSVQNEVNILYEDNNQNKNEWSFNSYWSAGSSLLKWGSDRSQENVMVTRSLTRGRSI